MYYNRSIVISLIAIVLLIVTSACSSAGPSAGMPSPEKPSVELKVNAVTSGLEAPWGLAFLPDGRALVSERDSGKLLLVTSSGHVEEVQRLPAHGSGEGGFLGIALSPNYTADGLVYAYFSTAEENRVVRFRLGEEPEPIMAGPRSRVLVVGIAILILSPPSLQKRHPQAVLCFCMVVPFHNGREIFLSQHYAVSGCGG